MAVSRVFHPRNEVLVGQPNFASFRIYHGGKDVQSPRQPMAGGRSMKQANLLFRPGHDVAIGSLVMLGLVLMMGWWFARGGHRGELTDLDAATQLSTGFRVDLNRASWPELAQIAGVGETLARRIVRRRQEHGPFRDLDELQTVHGVGPKLLARMRPYLLLRAPGETLPLRAASPVVDGGAAEPGLTVPPDDTRSRTHGQNRSSDPS
jgi:competence protein ComEA